MNVARGLFANHNDPDINPLRWAMVADTGFMGASNDGSDGRVPVFRPLKEGEAKESNPLYAVMLLLSAWLTAVRQCDEWGQASIKRSFPHFSSAVQVRAVKAHGRDIMTMLRLYNLRTRVVGFNQLTTTFKRYVDANFAEQVDVARRGDEGMRHYMAIAKRRFDRGVRAYGNL
jgi:hypothetical protein